MSSFVILFLSFVAFVVLVTVFYRIDKRTNILRNPQVQFATQIFVALNFLFGLWVAFHRLLIILIATPILLLLFLLGRRGVFKTRNGQLFLWTLVILFLVIVNIWALNH